MVMFIEQAVTPTCLDKLLLNKEKGMQIRLIIVIIFILVAGGVNIYAQNTVKVRLLQDSLVMANDDSTKARLLNAIGWQYHNSDPNTAMYYVREALAIAQKKGDKKNIAISKYYTGRLYYTLSNDTAALRNFDEALSLDSELNNLNEMSIVHMYKGYTYNHMNRTADMLKEFLISLKLAEQSGDKRRVSDALYALGDYYLHQDAIDSANAKNALPYFLQALATDKELNIQNNIATDYQYLGLCYIYLGKTDEAEEHLTLAKQMFQELNDNFHLATAESYLGSLYQQTKNIDKSIESYKISMELMEKIGSKLEAADNADNIATNYLTKKDYANAIKYAQHGLILASQINAQKQLFFLYSTLAKASAAINDFERAYNYSAQAAAFKDSVNESEQHDELDELQTKYETEKKEKENQLLKTQNLATNAQLQTNRVLLIAALACLLMLAILLYFLYRNRQAKIKNIETLKMLNKQLEEQKEEITRINTLLELKALRAQMNPHFIFNCMSSIQECMLTGRLDEANTYLSKLSRLLRMVLIHSDDENIYLDKEIEVLKLYLELESVRLKGGFSYSIEMDEDIPTEELMVPALLLQPFAENAIWHGLLNKEGERNLSITIQMKDETLCCIIKDNGIGRQQSALMNKKHKQHISKGMTLIEKRLQILKQQTGEEKTSLNITDLFTPSNEPAGTSVEIILPLIAE